MPLIHEDLTGEIINNLMQVHTEIGPGLDEKIYQKACISQFNKSSLGYVSQPSCWITHREQRIKELIPDFVIENKVVLDLKSLLGAFAPVFFAQVLCYCKLCRTSVGFLANFGLERLSWKRLAYTPAKPDLLGELDASSPSSFSSVIDAVRYVVATHGVGYTEDIYRLLLEYELKCQSIPLTSNPYVNSTLNSQEFESVSLPILLVDESCPVYVIALHDSISATHMARMCTYLRCLSLPSGILINFASNQCQFVVVNLPET